MEKRLVVKLSVRGTSLHIEGPKEKISHAKFYFDKLQELEDRGNSLNQDDYHIALDLLEGGQIEAFADYIPPKSLDLSRKSVRPKSLNQKEYIDAIKTYDLVFGIGPAGTGKTYLAMAVALYFVKNKSVSRIILTRPAL